MNFYEKYLLPRLLDLAMRNREVTRYRSHIVPQAHGTVLEVGLGSGLNLPFYASTVRQLYAVDPSEALLTMARKKAALTEFPIAFLAHSAEALPIGDHSVDTVITTFTLCTIPEPMNALREMKRVLKPGGALLFAEHGLAPDAPVRRWQQRLNPLWKRITGGCSLDRKMDALIAAAGFRITDLTSEYAKGPRPMTYIYSGRAVPG